MGGYGSGRWHSHSKAATVEESRAIDISSWVRDDVVALDTYRRGLCVWKNSYSGEQVASIGYEANTTASPPWVRLYYTCTPFDGEPEHYDYKIHLLTTRPHFGGVRWWFECPLVGCGRRVSKLYLAPGARYFGCRHCYHLTYESCQESHKYDGLWRQIGSELGYDTATVGRLMNRIMKHGNRRK